MKLQVFIHVTECNTNKACVALFYEGLYYSGHVGFVWTTFVTWSSEG